MFKKMLLAGFLAAGCGHGGDVPYDVAFCGAAVHPCPGFPTRDTLDDRHVVQADCDDYDLTLSCQVDTGRTYALAACAACSAPWLPPSLMSADDLARVGVHLCDPLAYREGAWCATCADPALSFQHAYSAPSQGGYASDVACVRECGACAVSP